MGGVLLTIAYDGTGYSGFQFQENAITIQEVLEKALQKLEGTFIRVKGASRTDAGVHAKGQRVFFISSHNLPQKAYLKGLNALLPEDVGVLDVRYVPKNFNPRLPLDKTYVYTILNRITPNPLTSRYHWQIFKPLNIGAMQEACRYFLGTHDFKSFQATDCDRKNTMRTITQCSITQAQDYLYIKVTGTAFLKNMVRIMVGSLVEIGKNRFPPIWIKELLLIKDRTKAGPTAPAKGLCLENIRYKEEEYV